MVFSVPKPRNLNPVVVLVSLMDDDEAALAKAGLDGRGAIAVRKALIDIRLMKLLNERNFKS